MIARLVIPGTFPGLNQYSDAERSRSYAAARLKREAEARIIEEAHHE